MDTWSGGPWVVTASAAALKGVVGQYGYVSSSSVYVWGTHRDESSAVVAGDMHASTGDYAALKRGAELGVCASFPDAVLARAGLILGPHEDIGRLPWWLRRIARGGQIVAPGRPARPLQYIDVRDFAAWLLRAVAAETSGAVDVIGRSGFATTAALLDTCRVVTDSDADLVWIDEIQLAEAGVEPWTHLPCWVPERGEFAGFLEVDTFRAAATGLKPRPLHDTVADTWTWLTQDGYPIQRGDRDVHGLPAEIETELLSLKRSL